MSTRFYGQTRSPDWDPPGVPTDSGQFFRLADSARTQDVSLRCASASGTPPRASLHLGDENTDTPVTFVSKPVSAFTMSGSVTISGSFGCGIDLSFKKLWARIGKLSAAGVYTWPSTCAAIDSNYITDYRKTVYAASVTPTSTSFATGDSIVVEFYSQGGGFYGEYYVLYEDSHLYVELTEDVSYAPAQTVVPTQPVVAGAIMDLEAAYAKSKLYPGNNTDPTSTWADLAGNHDVTLTNFAYAAEPAATNYCTNPSMELATNNIANGWGETGTSAVLLGDTVYTHPAALNTGSYSQTMTLSAQADASGSIYYFTFLTGDNTFVSGDPATLSFFLKGTNTGTNVTAFISERTSADVSVLDTAGSTITVGTTGSRYALTVSSMQATTKRLRVGLKVSSIDAADSFALTLDDVQIEKASVVSAYIDGYVTGCSWDGTANASTSSRPAGLLVSGWQGSGTDADPYALHLDSTDLASPFNKAITGTFAQASGQWAVETWLYWDGNSCVTGRMPLAHGTSNADGWYFLAYNTSFRIRLNRSGTYQDVTLTGNITASTWTHLVFVCDNTAQTGTWYKNGVAQTPVALTAPMVPPTSTRPVYIGTYGNSSMYTWPGAFSAFRYYASLLSDTDVAQNYACGMSAGIPSAGAFGSVTIVKGAVSRSLTGISTAGAFGTVTVLKGAVTRGPAQPITPGESLELRGSLAKSGTSPGVNSPLTTTWADTSGSGTNGTLTNFTTWGDTASETGTTALGWANQKGGTLYVAGYDCVVSSLTVRRSNTGTGHAACNIKGLIYADSSGAPGALLGTSNATAVADNAAAGATTLTFASPVSLSAGSYWLCIIGDASAVGLTILTSAAGSYVYNADTYSDGATDPFGTPTTVSGHSFGIYATHTAVSWIGSGTDADPYRLQGDRVNDYITMSFLDIVSSKVFTVEAWTITPSSAGTTYHTIFGEYGPTVTAQPLAMLALYQTSGRAIMYMRASDNTTGHTYGPVTNVCDGELHHIVASCNGSQTTVYVDGSPGTPVNVPSGDMVMNSTRVMGCGYSALYNYGGSLAAFRIYSSALSAAQIAHNYSCGPESDGIPSEEAFGSVSTVHNFTRSVTGIATAGALGSVTVLKGAVTRTLTGIATAGALGTVTVLHDFTRVVTGIATAGALGSVTALKGAVTRAPLQPVVAGAVLNLDAAYAKLGISPGDDSPLTTSWDDTSGNGHDGTLVGFSAQTFGDTTAESTPSNTNFSNYHFVVKGTLAQVGPLSRVSVYLSNTNTGHALCHMKALIYDDNSGAPGNLIAIGDEVAIANNAALAWVDLPFVSPVILPAADYWVGFTLDSTGAGVQLRRTASQGAGNCAYYTGTYASPPDPFGTMTTNTYAYAIYGASEPWQGTGVADNPYRLQGDASGDYFTLPFVDITSSKVFTLEAWVVTPTSSPNSYDVILSEYGPTVTVQPLVMLCIWSSGGKAAAYYRDSAGGPGHASASANICDGGLHHIVISCDGTHTTVYADGVPGTPADVPAGATVMNTTRGFAYGTSYKFNGAAAIIRAYQSALSAADVAQNYACGVSSGIPSDETFGSATVVKGEVTRSLAGVATAGAFGTVTVLHNFTRAVTGVATAGALGTVTVLHNFTRVVTGIATAGAFGSVTVVKGAVTRSLTGVATAGAFGTVTVVRGAVTRALTGIGTSGAFGIVTTSGSFTRSVAGIAAPGPVYTADLTPTMVSNTSPSGVASASGTFIYDDADYGPWHAFNKNASDGWWAYGWSGWLRYQFPTAQVVKRYTLQASSGVYCYNSWTFQGSNDASNWDTLDSQTHSGLWSAGEKHTYDFSNTTAYLYYQVDGNDGNNSYILGVAEFEMMGATGPFGNVTIVRGTSLTGIPSAEAFGTVTVLKGAVIRSLTGIATAGAFGTVTVLHNFTRAVTGIATAEAFGTVTVLKGTVTRALTGIATSGAFGTVTVLHNFTRVVTGITTSEVLGSVTVLKGAVTRALTGIATAGASGTVTVLHNFTRLVTGVATGEAFGTVTVLKSVVSRSLSGVGTAEAFGTVTVLKGAVIRSLTGIATAGAFGTVAILKGGVSRALTGIGSGEALGTVTVLKGTITRSLTGIPSAEAFGTVTVIKVAVTRTLTGVPTGEAFGTVAALKGVVSRSLTGIATVEVFGSVSVLRGGVSRGLSGIASGGAFGSVTISQTGFVSGVGGIVSAEAFGSVAILKGGVSRSLSGIATGQVLGSVTVLHNFTRLVTGVATGEAFGTVTVLKGVVSRSLSGISTGEALGAVTVLKGSVTRALTGIATGGAFGTVTVLKGVVSRSPTGILTGEALGAVTVLKGVVTRALTGIGTGEAFGAVTVLRGLVTRSLTGIGTSGAFGIVTILRGSVTRTPTGIGTAEAFGTVTVLKGTVTRALTGIATSGAFGTVTVLHNFTRVVTGIATEGAFGTVTVLKGGVTRSVTGIPTGEAFGAAVPRNGMASRSPTGIPSGEGFGTVTVLKGGVSRSLPGIPTGEAFGSVFAHSAWILIQPAGIGLANVVFFGWVRVHQRITIPVGGVSSGEQVGSFLQGFGVRPLGIESSEAFGNAQCIGNQVRALVGIPAPYMGDENLWIEQVIGGDSGTDEDKMMRWHGFVKINGGHPETHKLTNTIHIWAKFDTHSPEHFRVSRDGDTFSGWRRYKRLFSYGFTGDSGDKFAYVQFRSSQSHYLSPVFSAKVRYVRNDEDSGGTRAHNQVPSPQGFGEYHYALTEAGAAEVVVEDWSPDWGDNGEESGMRDLWNMNASTARSNLMMDPNFEGSMQLCYYPGLPDTNRVCSIFASDYQLPQDDSQIDWSQLVWEFDPYSPDPQDGQLEYQQCTSPPVAFPSQNIKCCLQYTPSATAAWKRMFISTNWSYGGGDGFDGKLVTHLEPDKYYTLSGYFLCPEPDGQDDRMQVGMHREQLNEYGDWSANIYLVGEGAKDHWQRWATTFYNPPGYAANKVMSMWINSDEWNLGSQWFFCGMMLEEVSPLRDREQHERVGVVEFSRSSPEKYDPDQGAHVGAVSGVGEYELDIYNANDPDTAYYTWKGLRRCADPFETDYSHDHYTLPYSFGDGDTEGWEWTGVPYESPSRVAAYDADAMAKTFYLEEEPAVDFPDGIKTAICYSPQFDTEKFSISSNSKHMADVADNLSRTSPYGIRLEPGKEYTASFYTYCPGADTDDEFQYWGVVGTVSDSLQVSEKYVYQSSDAHADWKRVHWTFTPEESADACQMSIHISSIDDTGGYEPYPVPEDPDPTCYVWGEVLMDYYLPPEFTSNVRPVFHSAMGELERWRRDAEVDNPSTLEVPYRVTCWRVDDNGYDIGIYYQDTVDQKIQPDRPWGFTETLNYVWGDVFELWDANGAAPTSGSWWLTRNTNMYKLGEGNYRIEIEFQPWSYGGDHAHYYQNTLMWRIPTFHVNKGDTSVDIGTFYYPPTLKWGDGTLEGNPAGAPLSGESRAACKGSHWPYWPYQDWHTQPYCEDLALGYQMLAATDGGVGYPQYAASGTWRYNPELSGILVTFDYVNFGNSTNAACWIAPGWEAYSWGAVAIPGSPNPEQQPSTSPPATGTASLWVPIYCQNAEVEHAWFIGLDSLYNFGDQVYTAQRHFPCFFSNVNVVYI